MTDWMSQLCSHVGVQAQYRGFGGQVVPVSPEAQVAVLQAMGLAVCSEADAQAQLHQMKAQDAQRPLPASVIVQAGAPCELAVNRPAEWWLEAEDGTVFGQGLAGAAISLPALPLGIHCLHFDRGGNTVKSWVLARPDRATRLDDHIEDPRIWGVQGALYGMTDGAAAHIGTYGLLGRYAQACAGHGADFLGVNPVHAMGQVRPDDVVSPYSPSHRAFLNTWHCAHRSEGDHRSGLQDALLDYPTALKHTTLALAHQYAAFCDLPENAPDKRAFAVFATQAGAELHAFALFEAISRQHGPDWRAWPAPLRTHDPETLAAFEAKHAAQIAQTKWAQWQADTQLSTAQSHARAAGMRVGLYLDLAVGPRLGGAETWDKGTSLVTGATLGAPPDPLGPLGQNWGLAPLSPLTCQIEGYKGFSRLLRSVMRHAGMIRIDHVLGLMRSFWIPDGGQEGAYVSYPFEALLAVVAIESARTQTIVVGEDLGLVPDGLRDALAASGIYGLDVLQYMRSSAGGFADTSKTRSLAVCTFATHDTPTIAGFFAAEDARVRHSFGGLDAQTLKEVRADRARAQETLDTSTPVPEIHRHLAQANASMVAIQLDDIAERVSQQNLPGTVDTYPNWRLKAPFSVDDITASPAFVQLAQTMRSAGRSNLMGMEKENDLPDCTDQAH